MSTKSIAVVGGGVIGLSCAWRLAARGARVTLLERDACGSGASGASLGVLMPATATIKRPLQNLQRQSLWTFPEFVEEVQEASGIDVGYSRCGLMEILHGADRHRNAVVEGEVASRDWPAIDGAPAVEILSPEAAADREPEVCCDSWGARFCRATACVDVERLLAALRAACERAGVTVSEGCEVTGLEMKADRVVAAHCGDRRVTAHAVLVTAGAWTPHVSPVLKRSAPIQPAKGQALLLQSPRSMLRHVIKRQKIYLAPRGQSGHVLLGSTTEREAGFDPRNTTEGIAALTAGAMDLVPAMSDAAIVRMWAGPRPEPLGRKPFLGRIPETANLFVAAGHFKTGIALAPITARIMAGVILDGVTDMDIEAFQPE